MSGCSLPLTASRWRRYGLVAVAGLPVLILSVVPLAGGALLFMAALLLLFYWHWYQVLQRPSTATGLVLTDTGELHWLPSHAAKPGKLLAGGLISAFAIQLRYQAADGKIHRCWILADQCRASDFRTLARYVNQANWPATDQRASR